LYISESLIFIIVKYLNMHIILNENQLTVFKKLAESDAPLLDDSNIVEKGDPSKVGTSAVITEPNGDPKMGKDTPTDKVSHTLANQDWRGALRARIG
jgi:hypothetical protein